MNNIWMIVRVGISLLSLLGVGVVIIAGWRAFRQITANHLFHIDEDLKELKHGVKENREKIVNIDKNVAIIATKINLENK